MKKEEAIRKLTEGTQTYSLHISRVPKNTLERFRKLASEEEFCQDYGNCLKFLLDFFYGLIPSGVEHLEQEIALIKGKIEELEQDKEKKKERRTLSGRVLK